MTDLTIPPSVELTETSWRPSGTMTFEQWTEAGRQLGIMGRACQWWIGDWVTYGEHTFGEKYSQAIEETGLDYQTLANCVYVSSHVDPSRRRENLSWSHHEAVAALPPAEGDEWLDHAAAESLTRDKLRAAIKATRTLDPDPEPAGTVFHTTIEFDHAAADYTAACAAIEALAEKLTAKGLTVTTTATRPA